MTSGELGVRKGDVTCPKSKCQLLIALGLQKIREEVRASGSKEQDGKTLVCALPFESPLTTGAFSSISLSTFPAQVHLKLLPTAPKSPFFLLPSDVLNIAKPDRQSSNIAFRTHSAVKSLQRLTTTYSQNKVQITNILNPLVLSYFFNLIWKCCVWPDYSTHELTFSKATQLCLPLS